MEIRIDQTKYNIYQCMQCHIIKTHLKLHECAPNIECRCGMTMRRMQLVPK